MKRSSRIFLNDLNSEKSKALKSFLYFYAQIVRYYIEMFWSIKDFSSSLADKSITDRTVTKYGITARLSQLAAKQAKEIVLSQRKKSKRKQKMPRFKNITLNVDSRFFDMTPFHGYFDWALKFSSGFPKLLVPFNNTEHTNKFLDNGWIRGNSIRLGLHKKRLFIDLIFEKQKPELKTEGEVVGCDLGYKVPLALSDGTLIGTELKEKIQKSGKRRKRFHSYIGTELNRIVKSIDFSKIKVLVLENLKNVKKHKRGKFSRIITGFYLFGIMPGS